MLAASVLCWLCLVSLVMSNPRGSSGIASFESNVASAKTRAQQYLSDHVASSVGAFASNLFKARDWNSQIPEKVMWEGSKIPKHF